MNYKMLVYERIDISDEIYVDKSDKSKECMLCNYWYFLDKNFSSGPHLSDRCYNMVQRCTKLKSISIVHIKGSVHNLFSVYE